MKYFVFWKDMTIQDKWFLDEPTTAAGVMLDGWNFTMGERYKGPAPVSCKPYQAGREIPVAFGGLDTPYLRQDIASTISDFDHSGVQCFSVAVEGARGDYWIVNSVTVLDAIHSSSIIEHYSDEEKRADSDLAMRYKYVRRLVLDLSKIEMDSHVFRLKYSLNDMIVSEALKFAIEAVCPQHGGKFTEIEVATR